MEGISEKDMNKWESSLLWFVKALTLHKQKRMMMKSPPHTGRIEVLARLFPGAKFIHIVRDPYSIFPSTRTKSPERKSRSKSDSRNSTLPP